MPKQYGFRFPIARNTDPASSHEAASKLATRDSHAEAIYDVLFDAGAWLTSHEISAAGGQRHGLDSVKITKRLNDLYQHGVVLKGEIRPCRITRRRLLTWKAKDT